MAYCKGEFVNEIDSAREMHTYVLHVILVVLQDDAVLIVEFFDGRSQFLVLTRDHRIGVFDLAMPEAMIHSSESVLLHEPISSAIPKRQFLARASPLRA